MTSTNTIADTSGLQPASDSDEPTAMPATVYASALAASNPYRSAEWYLDGYLTPGSDVYGADVDKISTEYDGKGVRIGLIDDGFDVTNPDLAGQFDLAASYDPRDSGASNIMPDSTSDVHGTWVAG